MTEQEKSIQQAFIDAMVDAQEVVIELIMFDEDTGFDRLVHAPFSNSLIAKLEFLFDSMGERHVDVTEKMIRICLSDYAVAGARTINRLIKNV